LEKRDEGYSLVELVVVILIFGVVMTLISASFNRIVASSGQILKTAETDIGGLIGLELLRIDLGYAGFGLPWALGGAFYSGEAKTHPVNGNANTDAALFNDSSANPPRAFATQNNLGFNYSDYLVMKGTALGTNSTARRWSYLGYSSSGAMVKQSKSEVELVPGNGDRVIALNIGMKGGQPVRELVTNGSSFSFTFDNPLPAAFQPGSGQDRYQVFGIAPAPTDPTDASDIITFPFNRVDYYIGLPSDLNKLSSTCAHGTGTLYRGIVSQKGNFKPYPILDCVADLQVIFTLDTSNDGSNWHTDDISSYDAAGVREHVKEVLVYILAQQGKKDTGYSYPVTDPDNAIVLGERPPPGGKPLGSVWKTSDLVATFGADWLHYHWKLYTIAVQPQNLE
jgi:prepilin-type N-terminal cleavage/methylation domain-containing protein